MKLKYIVLTHFCFFVFANASYACSRFEWGVPECASYTRADAVFFGKAIKVEDLTGKNDFPDGWRKVLFEVRHNLKGAENKTIELVTADWRAACGLKIKKGQTWYIFATYNSEEKYFEDFLGVKYSEKKDAEKIKSLKKEMSANINGEISGKLVSYPGGLVYLYEPAEVMLEGNENRQTIFSNDKGDYKFSALKAGNYKVRMKFPFRASLLWSGYDEAMTSFREEFPSTLDYEVELKAGDCDFRYFEVFKYSKNTKESS